MAINPLAFLGLALASIAGPHAPVNEEDKAFEILQKTLKNQRKVDYLHVESRPTPDGSASWKVKVQTSIARGIMVTILEPSYGAGSITLDDTKETKNYRPDLKRLVIQPSSYQLQPSFDLRWKLIRQNYTVELGKSDAIAGQKVRELHIKPVNEEIPTRHMFVDVRHFVVLKYTVDTESGKAATVFDTKYVEFGSGPANANFGLPEEAVGIQPYRFPGPKKLVSASDSRPEAGFSARMPEKLPYGFRVSGAYMFRPTEGPYVQVKLTDGMVTLTVFQWRKGHAKRPPDAEHVEQDAYSVSYGIAVVPGDRMPVEVLERLIEAFVESAE